MIDSFCYSPPLIDVEHTLKSRNYEDVPFLSLYFAVGMDS